MSTGFLRGSDPGSRDLECLADGQLDPAAFEAGRAVLTLRGRLLADGVARALT